MNGFVSFKSEFNRAFNTIISSNILHSKWINTLSYLENCGAKKIAACQHPTLVKEEMLKHASEEFRHAHYLKRQISKVYPKSLVDYHPQSLIGGWDSLHYLQALDLYTCRYLSTDSDMSPLDIRHAAYLLVTYAIELRAEELYNYYEWALKAAGSKVKIKSIILEEKEHLNEMKQGLHKIPSGFKHAARVCRIESDLCRSWLIAVAAEINTL